jgi:hypothetical protein
LWLLTTDVSSAIWPGEFCILLLIQKYERFGSLEKNF